MLVVVYVFKNVLESRCNNNMAAAAKATTPPNSQRQSME